MVYLKIWVCRTLPISLSNLRRGREITPPSPAFGRELILRLATLTPYIVCILFWTFIMASIVFTSARLPHQNQFPSLFIPLVILTTVSLVWASTISKRLRSKLEHRLFPDSDWEIQTYIIKTCYHTRKHSST